MWQYIEESHRQLLQRNGFSLFPDFMTFQGGKVLKQLPSRTILKIELPSGEGTKTFFLKRHRVKLHIEDMVRTFLSGFHRSWGRKEWEVMQAFQKSGIPTLSPVASGEKLSWFWQESFLMTEELVGFQSLELFLKNRFAPPLSRERITEKRAVIQELARITRTMHGAGFNHRDFYCCHIFIRRTEDGQRDWRILDLQRVDRRRWFRRRWIIKDLAALNYSAPSPVITRSDRLRFLRHYLSHSGSIKQASPLIQQIIRKTSKIRQHDQKLQQRKTSSARVKGQLSV